MRTGRVGDILLECEPRVRAYFRRRCRNQRDVDDLVQECMLAVLSSFHRFGARSSVQTWIYAICRNHYRTHVYYALRDRALAGRLGKREGDERTSLEESAGVRSILQSLIATLPRLEQELYRLHYAEGRRVREIARILGRPTGTVKYLLHELRAHVRALLA
jgi:RNA polymerase sigma-70 factor (ECF subfamily)